MAGWAPPRLEDFILTDKLGSGTYATVYKAYRKRNTREVVAIKCVSKKTLNKASVENLLTEIEILKTVHHPHILELKDFQWDRDYIFLITEYCAGGDLSRFIRSRRILPEKIVKIFLQQLACALKFLHERNISHLDLKPQNILLSNLDRPHLKLADFGFAQHMISQDESQSLRGSPLYMAPEMVCRRHYDARVDLWSVGVILYASCVQIDFSEVRSFCMQPDGILTSLHSSVVSLCFLGMHSSALLSALPCTRNLVINPFKTAPKEALFGRAPFASRSFSELEEKIRSHRSIELPTRPRVSPECRDLLQRLLERDPDHRISFPDFFNHPFVDMEHMPCAESLQKATSLVAEAVEKDGARDYSAALSLYCRALEYFVPSLHYETDIRRKEAIRSKCQLISTIEENPELWDTANPLYADRNRKKAVWEKVSRSLTTNWDRLTMKEKEAREEHVRRHWKSLRYCRDLYVDHALGRSGAAAPPSHKPHPYASQMSFLRRSMESRDTTSNWTTQEETPEQEDQHADSDASCSETLTPTPSESDFSLSVEVDTPQILVSADEAPVPSRVYHGRARRQQQPLGIHIEEQIVQLLTHYRKEQQRPVPDVFNDHNNDRVVYCRSLFPMLEDLSGDREIQARDDMYTYLLACRSAKRSGLPPPQIQIINENPSQARPITSADTSIPYSNIPNCNPTPYYHPQSYGGHLINQSLHIHHPHPENTPSPYYEEL